jgi:hypothetical protein
VRCSGGGLDTVKNVSIDFEVRALRRRRTTLVPEAATAGNAAAPQLAGYGGRDTNHAADHAGRSGGEQEESCYQQDRGEHSADH